MYSIEVRHLHNFQSDIPDKSSIHLSLYIVVTMLLTIFSLLYFMSSWLFCNHQFALPSPFTLSHRPPTPSSPGNPHFVLYVYKSISVLFVHLFWSFLDLMNKWNHMVFVFVWFISLSIIPSRSIHVVANGKISFLFNGQVIFHCRYVPCLLHPIVHWWTQR